MYLYRKSHDLEHNSGLIGTSDFESSKFENFQNHEYLLFTNCTRRSCDFLFIVHSARIRRFHGNLIGTPTEYNLGLIVLFSTNQNLVIFLTVL